MRILKLLKTYSIVFREEKQEQLSDVTDELEEQKSLVTKFRNEVCHFVIDFLFLCLSLILDAFIHNEALVT